MPTIYLENQGAYRPAVEDVTREDLFFAPAYRQARECLRSIVKNSVSFSGNSGALSQYPNNILAFCADRGHGKTSAMLSFSTALKGMGKDAPDYWRGNIRESQFFVLDPIDPTALEQTDSAVRTILSRMFQAVTEAAEGRVSGETEKAARRKLLARFQKCFRLADKQKAKEHRSDDYDDLYRLTEMGDSANLKMELKQLVGDFLSYLLAGTVDAAPGARFLVIQIDDADMNTTNAYEVVEDIRKYCMLPNVLVLLSVNMGLLEQTVENYFLGAHKHIVGTGTGDTAQWSRKRCHETAVNYLDKLVPGRHRIDLPDIDREMGNPWKPLKLWVPGQREAPGEYQRVLLEMLQDKCLFSLPEREMELHPFLPKRMRELVHFANLLLGMESPGITRREMLAWAQSGGTEAAEGQVRVLESNLASLMDYFLYHWCETRLDHQQRWALEAIHQARTEQKVAAAVEALGRLIPERERAITPDGWLNLAQYTDYFWARGQREFAAGVELIFHLHRDVLLVQDCIVREMEGKSHG